MTATPLRAETRGISPKVYVPALGEILVGVGLIIAGLDVEGRTSILAGVGTLVVGYRANPGNVVLAEDLADFEDDGTNPEARDLHENQQT